VFAAASMTEVVEELAARFETGRVVVSFGSSAALARQIEDGAPADLFFSASPKWTARLLAAGFVEGEAVSIAGNTIVCIAPRGAALIANGPSELLDGLDDGELVAIADAGVPAGEYARASLARVDLLDAYGSRLVGLKDVRAVLHAVEQGELGAGFVYATDAKLGRVEILFAFDATTYPAVEYRAVVLRSATDPVAAASFLAFVRGDTGRAALAAAGFLLPD
jgi:molybdate transport system substrate-binding protein